MLRIVIVLLVVLLLLFACVFVLSAAGPTGPLIRVAKCLSGGRIMDECRGGYLVDFQDIMPENLRVQNLQRMDTDGDGEEEWVVFYYYDITGGRGPIAGAVYDNDRGWPPVLFPYQLRVPDRDYLGEYGLTATQVNLIAEDEVPALFVWDGGSGLNIFRYYQEAKTDRWKPPEDRSPYFPVGVFRGDSVSFDINTKQVTVWDRGGFATGVMAADHERSQLANKRVYTLRDETYMKSGDDLTTLSSPMESYIEFTGGGMPDDIFATQYPEKVVLGFYKVLSNEGGDIKAEDFLTGEAINEYKEGRMDYFGVPWSKDYKDGVVRVTEITYSTGVEDQNRIVNSQGLHPLRGQVTVRIVAQPKRDQPALQPEPRAWVLVLQEGNWKIEKRDVEMEVWMR
jgi:hypothetical protein